MVTADQIGNWVWVDEFAGSSVLDAGFSVDP